MSVKFVSYNPPEVYTPPERDARDNDRAHAMYSVMHRIKTEHQAACVNYDGAHVADFDSSDPGHTFVDAATASLIVQVADSLGDNNRAAFLALSVAQMAGIAWSVTS